MTSLVLRWAVLPWTRNFSQSGREWFWTTLCCPLSSSSETQLLNLTCRHHLIADSFTGEGLLSTQMLYGIKENCRFGANPWMFLAFINLDNFLFYLTPLLNPFSTVLFCRSTFSYQWFSFVTDLTGCLVKILPLWKCSIVGKQIFCLFEHLSWLDLALFCKKKIVCTSKLYVFFCKWFRA